MASTSSAGSCLRGCLTACLLSFCPSPLCLREREGEEAKWGGDVPREDPPPLCSRSDTKDSSTVALVERKVPGSCGRPFIVPRTAVFFGLGGLLTFAVSSPVPSEPGSPQMRATIPTLLLLSRINSVSTMFTHQLFYENIPYNPCKYFFFSFT